MAIAAWLDERGGSELNRLKLLQGRTPRSGRHDEALVDTVAFDRLGYALGETVQLRLVSHAALWRRVERGQPAERRSRNCTYGPSCSCPDRGCSRERPRGRPSRLVDGPGRVLSPSRWWTARRPHRRRERAPATRIRGRACVRARRGAFRRSPTIEDSARKANDRAGAQEPIRLQARVLLLVAGLGAAALVLFIAQAFVREGVCARAGERDAVCARHGEEADRGRRRVQGCGHRRRARRAWPSWARFCSRPSPRSATRATFEASPGVDLDAFVLGVGAIVLVVATIAIALVVALRMIPGHVHGSSSGQARGRRTPAEAAARLGLPPAAVAGVRFALNRGTGATALPVRTTLAAVVLAVAVAASALTVARSLSYVLSTPRLYGVNFDYLFWPGGPAVRRLPPDRRLLTDPSIAAIASGTDVDVTIDGVPVVAAAFEGVKGTIRPATLIEGRAPRDADEILLGPNARGAAPQGGRHRGRSQRAVGRRCASSEAASRCTRSIGASPWATSTILTFQGLRRVQPGAVHYVYRLRIAPGRRSCGRARPARAERRARPVAGSAADREVRGARSLPTRFLGPLRGGRRDHARLRSPHLDPSPPGGAGAPQDARLRGRPVVATVAWQATTIAAVGLVVGLPLGTVLARFGWNVFADRLAILPRPVIPSVGAHARDPDHARPRERRRRLACTHRLANEAGSRTASGVMARHVR